MWILVDQVTAENERISGEPQLPKSSRGVRGRLSPCPQMDALQMPGGGAGWTVLDSELC